jgi:DNA-binding NarL/FixJ family response regulator
VIRVAIVSQATALRLGLRSLLEAGEGIQVVAEAADLAELDAHPHETDVLVLAAPRLPGDLRDLPLAQESPEASPALLLLSETGRLPPSLPGLAGAWGVLPLDSDAEELQAAVAALHAGLIVMAPPLAEPALQRTLGLQAEEMEALAELLTERELEVLQWLAQGLANKQIAVSLGISEHTVKFHVSAIYSKLGATNRTEAVRLGVQQGLVVL